MVVGLAWTLRAIQGAPAMPAAPAASFRKSRRPVLDFAGCAMPLPPVCDASSHYAGPGVLSAAETARLGPTSAAMILLPGQTHRQGRPRPSPTPGPALSGSGDRLLHEDVVGEDERGHRLHHGDGAREHARVVTPAALDGGALTRHAHGALLAHDSGRGLERDAKVDRLTVGDSALHSTRAIGARPHLVALHVELVVVLGAAQVRAREPRADLEALARRQAEYGLGQVGLEAIEYGLAPAARTATHGTGYDAAE